LTEIETLPWRNVGYVDARRLAKRQARSFQGERLPSMLPGVSISTQPDDYAAFKSLRIAVFDGTSWTLSGDPMSAD